LGREGHGWHEALGQGMILHGEAGLEGKGQEGGIAEGHGWKGRVRFGESWIDPDYQMN